jgi:peptidoglycan/LPS O-acetylase OafA/YrhL
MWSLATEEQFYLLWPFIEKYFKKTIFAILAIFLIINQFVNFNHKLITDWLGIEDMHVFQSTFTPILLGVGLAHLLHRKSTFSTIHRLISPTYTAPILLLALVAICSFLPGDISGLPRLLIQLTMVVFVGSVVINEKNMLMPILKFRPFARIGVISYGIYIFHIHGITIAEKVLHKLNIDNVSIIFLLGYTATIIIAELSFRLYEAPFLKLKAKFSSVHQAHT